jgi:hypothetical protein
MHKYLEMLGLFSATAQQRLPVKGTSAKYNQSGVRKQKCKKEK